LKVKDTAHTGWAKKVSYCTLSISSLNIDQFLQFFFTSGLCKKICYSVACTPHLFMSLHYLVKYKYLKHTVFTDGQKV